MVNLASVDAAAATGRQLIVMQPWEDKLFSGVPSSPWGHSFEGSPNPCTFPDKHVSERQS